MRTESQRAAIAAELANKKLGDNQHGGSANLPTLLVDQAKAAKLFNVSERSVRTAKVVKEADPELHSKEGSQIQLPSIKDAAKLMGVSQASVKAAKAVKEVSPELCEAGKRGEVSLNAAVKAVKPEPEPEPTSEPEISRVAPKTSGEEDISINTKGMTLLGMLLV